MKCNRAAQKLHKNVTPNKRLAAKVVLTFSAPSPDKVCCVSSQHCRAQVLGMPHGALSRVDRILIKKRRQLIVGKKGVYWALAKHKKGYSTNNKELRLLLVAAFNNHPHVIVLPNAKDTLQVKDINGKKVLVHKVLTQVGLGTIFSDIIRDNLTIKCKQLEGLRPRSKDGGGQEGGA